MQVVISASFALPKETYRVPLIIVRSACRRRLLSCPCAQVSLSEDQRVTAVRTYSRQAGAHALCCVGMALKCLAEGVRRLSEGGGACSSLIAGWVLQRNAEFGALSTSQAWTELLKVRAPMPGSAAHMLQGFPNSSL
jgi:hypothetical protein